MISASLQMMNAHAFECSMPAPAAAKIISLKNFDPDFSPRFVIQRFIAPNQWILNAWPKRKKRSS
jgi:hypothetical protein